jgi:hypothetical protein
MALLMLFGYTGHTKYIMKNKKEIKAFNKSKPADRYAPADFFVR